MPVLLQRWSFTCHLVVQALSPVYTPRKNRERPESRIYFKNFRKNTIFNEHPLHEILQIYHVGYSIFISTFTITHTSKPKFSHNPKIFSFNYCVVYLGFHSSEYVRVRPFCPSSSKRSVSLGLEPLSTI